MPHRTPDVLVHSQQHQIALSRWDNEGGAGPREEMGGVFAAGRGRVERRRRLTRGLLRLETDVWLMKETA